MWNHLFINRTEVTNITNEKLKKIEADIAKTKEKISEFTAKLRELERSKTEIENAGIIALVRDMDISPEELTAFIRAFKDKSNSPIITPPESEPIQNGEEDIDDEK